MYVVLYDYNGSVTSVMEVENNINIHKQYLCEHIELTEEEYRDICEMSATHDFRVENGEFVAVEKQPTPVTAENMMQLVRDVCEKLIVVKPQAEKVGFDLQLMYKTDGAFVWEYVPIEGYVPENDGTDYLKPITYVEGMTVATGLWYTNGDDIWEAIADGVPDGFNDTNYFDIVG